MQKFDAICFERVIRHGCHPIKPVEAALAPPEASAKVVSTFFQIPI
jgi:hypothetical protein